MKAFTNFTLLFIGLLILTPGAMAQNTLVVQPGQPTLDGVISPNEWTSTPLVTTRGVTLNAMADGEYLYVAATWNDATEDASHNRLTYDGAQWNQDGDEDRIAFLFDMGQTGADGANCAAFCHFPKMSTNGGVVDVWNWQAGRSNPMGYSIDTYWDAGGQKFDEGVSTVLANNLTDQGLPEFMATTDPGAIKAFLVENAAALDAFDPYGTMSSPSVEEAVPFNEATSFNTNDYISGYVHREPSGDVADIRAAGKYSNGAWTVEFRRKYEGGDHDFEVVPGGSVKFSHEVFDNQGSSHALDSTPPDVNVYTLDFSAITSTSVEPIDEEIPSEFVLNQNYPNPFNPETTIDFSLPRSSHVTLRISTVIGQTLATPINQELGPGAYRVNFDASDLPSGVYIYTLITDQASYSKQMTLLK